ncbi:MAG: Uma2 family endonuclease [Planctomycetes bacterium]|nr:Uma2 family endonuclease [Planctomycetota bacterium]
MVTANHDRATLDDLYATEGKAELIGGRIVHLMATGRRPNRVCGRIVRSLDDFSVEYGRGESFTATVAFAVPELPSGRRSFSPDASWYDGPFPANEMWFIEGPPTFAAEVRSESDYGPAAEEEMAEKRADYFTAGTLAVWDVNVRDECIRLYRPDDPQTPLVFRRGDTAHAEPAVPGWTIDVDGIFA